MVGGLVGELTEFIIDLAFYKVYLLKDLVGSLCIDFFDMNIVLNFRRIQFNHIPNSICVALMILVKPIVIRNGPRRPFAANQIYSLL